MSTVMTGGGVVWEACRTLRKQRSAASISRVVLSMKSHVAPVASTARYREYHCFLTRIRIYVSSTRYDAVFIRNSGRQRLSSSEVEH